MAEVIRDAEERDLERIVELYGQFAPSGDNPEPGSRAQSLEALGKITAREGVRLLVLEADGRVEGSVVLVIVPNLTHGGRPWAVIEHMVVEESRRGTGMGRRLLRRVEETVVEAGCYKLQFLSAWRRKDTAHPFSRRWGTSRRRGGFGNTSRDGKRRIGGSTEKRVRRRGAILPPDLVRCWPDSDFREMRLECARSWCLAVAATRLARVPRDFHPGSWFDNQRPCRSVFL